MKRRFFQIHLLTAVVGMVVLSGFVWMNSRVRRVDIVERSDLQGMIGGIPAVNPKSGPKHNVLGADEKSLMPWMPDLDLKEADLIQTMGTRLFSGRYASWGWPAVISETKHNSHALGVEEENLIPWMPVVDHQKVNRIQPTGQCRGQRVLTVQDIRRDAPELVSKIQNVPLFEADFPSWNARIDWKGLITNVVVAIATTLAVIFGTEWILRRRERSKV